VSSTATVAGASLTLDGGSGVKVTIGPDGAVKADFTGMQPAVFTTMVGTTQVKGDIAYQGSEDGKVDLSATGSSATTPATTATAQPGGATGTPTAGSGATSGNGASGSWQPSGQVNSGDLKITVRLTAPLPTTLVNNVKVSEVGGQTAQAGAAIDLQPLLRAGTFQCDGQTNLVITTSSGGGPSITWKLTRA